MRNVTVFGGSGFLGRHIVQKLAQDGAGVRVATRRPELAGDMRLFGAVGQVVPIQANVRNEDSIRRAIEGADAVINLTGILFERGRQSFAEIHVEAARRIARAAASAGARALVHVSAVGADPESPSVYARSKAAGEEAVRGAFPNATILRPSIVFGPEDDFFNRFAAMIRLMPVVPLFFERMPRFVLDGIFLLPEFEAGTTRFQPVYVGDVAEAARTALTDETKAGKTYELGGPAVCSYRELMEMILSETRRRAFMVPVPFFAARVAATFAQFTPIIAPPLTPDQVRLLKIDNVVADGALGLGDLAINPTALEMVLPTYLHRYRRGRIDSTPVPLG